MSSDRGGAWSARPASIQMVGDHLATAPAPRPGKTKRIDRSTGPNRNLGGLVEVETLGRSQSSKAGLSRPGGGGGVHDGLMR
jgi:hypothetical protein